MSIENPNSPYAPTPDQRKRIRDIVEINYNRPRQAARTRMAHTAMLDNLSRIAGPPQPLRKLPSALDIEAQYRERAAQGIPEAEYPLTADVIAGRTALEQGPRHVPGTETPRPLRPLPSALDIEARYRAELDQASRDSSEDS